MVSGTDHRLHRFGRSTHVCRYWLVHCEGFTVLTARGQPLGSVEQVLTGVTGRSAAQLAVRRGASRSRQLVPAAAVKEVAPWEETIVLATEPAPEQRSRARPAVTTLVDTSVTGARASRRHASHVLQAARPQLRRAARTVLTASRRVAGVLWAALAVVARAGARVMRERGVPAARAIYRKTVVGGLRAARALDSAARTAWRHTLPAGRAGGAYAARTVQILSRSAWSGLVRLTTLTRRMFKRHAPAARRRLAGVFEGLHRGR